MFEALAGIIVLVALPADRPGGKLAGYYMVSVGSCGTATLVSLISSNIAGYTKKTTVAAMFFIGYCAGNIIGESHVLRVRRAGLSQPREQ